MRLTVALVGLLLSCFSQAANIEFAGYQYKYDSGYVESQELQWLRWDIWNTYDGTFAPHTLEQALEDLSDGIVNEVYVGKGWELASNQQVASLFNAFGFADSSGHIWNETFSTRSQMWDDEEHTTQRTGIVDSAEISFTTDIFIEIFGANKHNIYDYCEDGVCWLDIAATSIVRFGYDNNQNGRVNWAYVSNDVNIDRAVLGADAFGNFERYAPYAFVRSVQVSTTGSLLLSAMFLLFIMVFRKTKRA